MDLYCGGATENFEQDLHSLSCGHYSQDEGTHTDKCPVRDYYLRPGLKQVINRNRILCFKTLSQLLKSCVGHDGNPVPKTHKVTNAIGVPDFTQPLFNYTSNEDIARKERFSYAHNAAAGRSFHSKSRVKNFQTQIHAHIRSGNVLVLRLCPCAVPS